MKTAFLTIGLFLISFHAFSEEKVLYCQSEHATGIAFDKKTNSFRTNRFVEERFTLNFKIDYSILLGWKNGSMECKKPYSYASEDNKNTITCFSDGRYDADFLMYNLSTKKFIGAKTSKFGYTNPKGQSYYDTNVLYAGKCEDF